MYTEIILAQSPLRLIEHNIGQKVFILRSPFLRSISLIADGGGTAVGGNACIQFFLSLLLPTKDLHKVLADLYMHVQGPCASTCTQLTKLTNVLKTWMILEMLRISPVIFGLSSSAFAKQDWNRQKSPFEPDKSISLAEPSDEKKFHLKLGKFKTFSAY